MKEFLIKISGNSMWPLFKEGDEVMVMPNVDIQPGDIVCIRENQKQEFNIHRLLTNQSVKGDNTPHFDHGFTIIGKVEKGSKSQTFNYLTKKALLKLSPFYNARYPKIIRVFFKAHILFINFLTRAMSNEGSQQ